MIRQYRLTINYDEITKYNFREVQELREGGCDNKIFTLHSGYGLNNPQKDETYIKNDDRVYNTQIMAHRNQATTTI